MTDECVKAEQLREIVTLSSLVTSSLDPREIRRRAVEASVRLVGAERASLLLLEGKGDRLYFEVALGEDAEKLERVRIIPGQGIAGAVARSCQPVVINDVQADPRYWAGVDQQTGFVTRSMICVPLACKGQTLGVLQVMNKADGAFTDDDLQLISTLGNQIAIGIENARLHERLRHNFLEMWIYAAVLVAVLLAAGWWLVSLGR